MLPDGVQVNQKILKSVGERVRGFKYSLRCKYVKEDTTKEALYNLEKSKRPSAVGDQMWVGLVDYFFSQKFQVSLKTIVFIMSRCRLFLNCLADCLASPPL